MTHSEGQQLVVVIHHTKLYDALLDRQVINTNWMNEYKTVRTAIDASYPLSILQDDESIRLLQDTKASDSLTYFDCKKILDRLIQSSVSKQTNILGQYTSPILNQWVSIVKMFEKSNLHIAEGAVRLEKIINSSLPTLQTQLHCYKRQIGLNQQRIHELHEVMKGNRQRADYMCLRYGIPGKDFASEMKNLLGELSALLGVVRDKIQDPVMDSILEHHTALQLYLKKHVQHSEAISQQQHHTKPDYAPLEALQKFMNTAKLHSDNISDSDTEWLELLLQTSFRRHLHHDLLELSFFCRQRHEELVSNDLITITNQYRDICPVLKQQTIKTAEESHQYLEKILSLLQNNRLQQLLYLHYSESEATRQIDLFSTYLSQISKWKNEVAALESKSAQFTPKCELIQSQIANSLADTKQIMQHLEKSLTPYFKNHIVNVVGMSH